LFDALQGQNPREAPVVVGLKHRTITRYFREARTQQPRLVGLVRRFGGGITAELNGMWVHPG